jgi:hypothetical protein
MFRERGVRNMKNVNDIKNLKSEHIISAIGFLDEEHVERVAAQRNASKLNSSAKKTRIKLPSMQATGMAAAVLLLVVGTVAMFYFLAPEDIITPVATIESPSVAVESPNDDTQKLPKPPKPPKTPTIEDVTWFVEPIFNHDVWFCDMCDAFGGGGDWGDGIIDERTALPTGNEHGAHGGIGKVWIYDPVLNLFGHRDNAYSGSDMVLEPAGKFAEHFPEQINQLLNVLEVDSTMKEDTDWGSTTLPPNAFTGKVAAIFNGQLVSNFEFEAIGHDGWYYNSQRGRVGTVMAVTNDNRFGVLDRHGDTIVPFEFDEILIIDDYTAFAKVGDFWGIITWVDIEDVPHRESLGGSPPYVLPPCTLVKERMNIEILEQLKEAHGDDPWGGEANDLFTGKVSDVFYGIEHELTVSEFNEMFGTELTNGSYPSWVSVVEYYKDRDTFDIAFYVFLQFGDTISHDTPLKISR